MLDQKRSLRCTALCRHSSANIHKQCFNECRSMVMLDQKSSPRCTVLCCHSSTNIHKQRFNECRSMVMLDQKSSPRCTALPLFKDSWLQVCHPFDVCVLVSIAANEPPSNEFACQALLQMTCVPSIAANEPP